MKRGFNILLIMCAALLAISCNKGKTYTAMLKAEKKAINRLIDKEGIEVLDDYPEDGVFKPNQFVKLDNDVYLNVIDSGNGNRPVLASTKILCRFIANPLLGDTTSFNTLTESNSYPEEFTYGYNTSTSGQYTYVFIGEGLASALAYVGDSAYVKMIVPFKRFTQQTYFNTNGIPVYFEKVKFVFEK